MSRFCLSRSALNAARVVFASAIVTASSATVHAQQVGVSVLPGAQRVQWSKDLPFDDDYMYGGRVALRFGKWVELQPFYFFRDGLGLDSTRALSAFGPLSAGKDVDVQHYGSSLQFNLGDAAFVPFARVSAGVLRLEPDSAARQDRITMSAGGGVRFGFAGLNAELYAEQMGFRMNPGSLFGVDTSLMANPMTLRNFVYGAAITIPLSTMREDEGNAGGLSGSSAPLEPFVGRLRYAGEHGLPDLEVAGLRAGIDFSPVFGIRGFYWRGLNDDRDGPAPVAGYGGEGQFNLSTGQGLSPFLIVGAGQIDYKDNFADSLGVSRVDKTALILGAGASFRLTDRLRLNGAVRDYIMTVDENLDNVASTGDLTHNTMITAGLTISFGGKSTPSSAQRERERDAELREMRAERDRAERMRDPRDRMMDRDGMTDRERMMERERMMDRDARVGRMMADSVRMYRDSTIILSRPNVRGGSPDVQWITIPVPAQGEIILRYGMPVRADSMTPGRDTVMMRSATPPSGDLAAQLLEIERRLTARIDAVQRQTLTPSATPNVTVVTPETRNMVVQDRNGLPVFQRLQRTRTADLRPYVGLGFDDGDTQLILGTRADLGPISAGSGFNFVPELAVGLGGGGTSVLAMANVQYAFGSIGGANAFRPYVTVGGGIYSPTVLGINTSVGTSYQLRTGADKPLLLNVELQGINLFSKTRILVGVSRTR